MRLSRRSHMTRVSHLDSRLPNFGKFKSHLWKEKQKYAPNNAGQPGTSQVTNMGPTFQKPRPRRRQKSSRCTRPSRRLTASQHWAEKNQPWPECSSFTITWLTNQFGDGPLLSCHRRIFWSGPSWLGVLMTQRNVSWVMCVRHL